MAMTKVDICSCCGTLYEGEDRHCRRCGADRETESDNKELRDLCSTYTGEDPVTDPIHREVKPIFEPRWGKVQWYELSEKERKKRKG
jgi:hypothetical protein